MVENFYHYFVGEEDYKATGENEFWVGEHTFFFINHQVIELVDRKQNYNE